MRSSVVFQRAILVLLLVLALALAFLPGGRVAARTVLLLPQFFPGAPARPLEWVTPAPKRSAITLTHDGRESRADLYLPGASGKHGAVVIFLGVAPAGRDDPRVVRLGEGLARVGLITLIPQSQDLIESKVDPGEIDELVAAVQYLAARPDVAPDRIGIGGFCIGAGLALDAAADPRISDKIALVNSFTGYYDLTSYMESILTHSIEPYPPRSDGQREPWEPAPNAIAVLADHLISLDEDPAEQAILRAAAHDPNAPRPNQDRLSPTGQIIWGLLNTRDPAIVRGLLAELPPEAQGKLRRLSPSTHLDQVRAKVYLMHDRGDATVPYVQSRLLAAHLPPGQVEYDEFQFFNHVDPVAAVSPLIFVQDLARLGWHMFQILAILTGST